jgi:hypothetical protein
MRVNANAKRDARWSRAARKPRRRLGSQECGQKKREERGNGMGGECDDAKYDTVNAYGDRDAKCASDQVMDQ